MTQCLVFILRVSNELLLLNSNNKDNGIQIPAVLTHTLASTITVMNLFGGSFNLPNF